MFRKDLSFRGAALIVAALFISALVFTGCSDDEPVPAHAAVIGTWASLSDSYVITDTTLSYFGYSDGTDNYSFAGNIKYSGILPGSVGVIIVQYAIPPHNSYGLPNHNNGFQAVYYKDSVTAGEKVFAGASDIANFYAPADTDNLGDAINQFTSATFHEDYIGGAIGTAWVGETAPYSKVN
jgi:hypothetical protein